MSTNKAKLEALLGLFNSAVRQAIAEYEKAGQDVPFIDSAGFHPLDNAIDQVALKHAVRTLEGAGAQLCTALAPPAHTIFNLVKVFDYACVRVALREDITDILVNYPNGIHVNDLSKIINIDPKKLARVMRVLATRGCYNEVDTDTFANNRLSLTLHSENPIRYTVDNHVEGYIDAGAMLYESLKDPRTAFSDSPEHSPIMYANNKRGITGTFFDWVKQEDVRRERFQRAMPGLNNITGSLAVLTQFPFEKYSTVVDVGGGVGAFSLPLAKMYKHIEIIIQDLPEVLNQSRSVWAKDYPEAVQENRVRFSEIDFLTQIPVEGKDIYYLRNVIHDWPDQESTLILRNVCQAMGPHSRVLIHDYVLGQPSRKQAEVGVAAAPEPMLANYGAGNIRMYQQDLTMWFAFNGKERTLQDSLKLSTAAGLKLENFWDLGETCILEFSAV